MNVGRETGETQLLEKLSQRASQETGFTREALRPEALNRFLKSQQAKGRTGASVLALLDRSDPELVRELTQAVTVGETYFFRQPEHFQAVADFVGALPQGAPVRAWSAGCATGEEAYSLAACLTQLAKGKVSVIGTDLNPRHLLLAEVGNYGTWSTRQAGPMLHPLLDPLSEGRSRVLPSLKEATRFVEHNLLKPLPEGFAGAFEIVFCRNVLCYLSDEARNRALEALVAALAPGGLIAFSAMDVAGVPEGLRRFGPQPEDQLFRRAVDAAPGAQASRPRPSAEVPAVVPAARSAPLPSEQIALHLQALTLVEAGKEYGAAQLLERLKQKYPDYLPGLLELALSRRREGKHVDARRLMQDVLGRAAALPPDAIVEGPQPLPARYYAASAEAYLGGVG